MNMGGLKEDSFLKPLSINLLKTISSCFILTIMSLIQETQSYVGVEPLGKPLLENCAKDVTGAAETFINQNLIIIHTWTDKSELLKEKILGDYYDPSCKLYIAVPGEKKGEQKFKPSKPASLPVAVNPETKRNHKITVSPYYLDPGLYKVETTIRPNNNGKEKGRQRNFTVSCFFKIKGHPPIAKIKGGATRKVHSHTNIILNGNESYYIGKQKKKYYNLKYKWTCEQKLKPATVCAKNPISTKSKFTLSGKDLTQVDTIKIKLLVETPYGAVNETTQEINIFKDKAMLEYGCSENCPPRADYRLESVYAVRCHDTKSNRFCKGIHGNDYEWTVTFKNGTAFGFNYEKDSYLKSSKKMVEFIIRANALSPGEYKIAVKLKDTAKYWANPPFAGATQYNLPPQVDKCYTDPREGESEKTNFSLKCEGKAVNTPDYRYEVLVRDRNDASKKKSIIKDNPSNIFQSKFNLPLPTEEQKFAVNVSSAIRPSIEIDLDTVVRPPKSTNEIVDVINEFYDEGENPISNMIDSNDPKQREKAVEMFHDLVDEVINHQSNDSKFQNTVDDLKYKVLKDLNKAKLKSMDDILRIGEDVTKLLKHQEPTKPNTLLSKLTINICKKLIDSQMDLLKKEKFPLDHAKKTKSISNVSSKCLETNTNPVDEIFQDKINTTTPAPSDDSPVVTEHYADYPDQDDEYLNNMKNLKETSKNMVNASAVANKITAMTMAVGDETVQKIGQKTASTVAKDLGKRLAKTTVSTRGVSLIPSQDWKESNHPFDILISTWNYDLLWWNPNRTRVATFVTSIEFWHSTCKERVSAFQQPVHVFLTKRNNTKFHERIFAEKITIPKNFHNLSTNELNRRIIIRRVILAKAVMLRVHFFNLSEPDAFDVVITKFHLPTLDDFARENTTINFTKSTVSYISDEDIWCYIGILPSQYEVAKKKLETISFEISYTLVFCVRWDDKENEWERSCKSGGNSTDTTVHCECKDFSIIAGYIQNVQSVPQYVIAADLEIELQANFIIFITVAITLGLFCLLAAFGAVTKKREIYYLADNKRSHHFAYLLIVRTKGNLNSGTTSNVTIKLVGKKKSSDPHVLNYPDPSLNLLQSFSENMFVLTTKSHLGDITHIELWNDSTGRSPSWYCRDIRICDLQDFTEWYFKIRKRLGVLKNSDPHIIAKPEFVAEKDKRLIRRLRSFKLFLHTWWLFHNEDNVCYLKKLTLLLSKILTIYTLVMLLYGLPNLDLYDAFDSQYYRVTAMTVLYGFICGLPAFLFHNLICWGFRLSKSEFSRYEDLTKRPFSVTLTCWLILIGFIVTSLTILIVFGFWVPWYESWIWLTTCAIALAFDIFVYEVAAVIIQNLVCRLERGYNVKQRFSSIMKIIDEQRVIIYKRFGNSLLRPYFRHLYKPLPVKKIKEKTITIEHRRHVISELEDLIMFGIYVVILYLVILAGKDDRIVLAKTNVIQMMDGEFTRTRSFSSIEKSEEIYEYINQTLIPAIHPLYWYEKYAVSNPGMTTDMHNKIIGIVRIRQQRMQAHLCEVAKQMEFLNMSCWPEFTMVHSESDRFSASWEPYSLEDAEFDRLISIWDYTSEAKAGTLTTFGEFAAYPGGGYIAYLGRTLHNSYTNFRRIFEKFWIDENTRIVFIEFLLYTADYNLFTSVKIIIEESATGYIQRNIEAHPARMLFVSNEMKGMTFGFFILFMVWLALLFFKKSLGLVLHFRTLFRDFWFLVDIGIIVISIICIVIYIVRTFMVRDYLVVLETMKHNEFLNYFYLFYIELFLMIISAFLLCIATIRLWKFLRFAAMFRVLEATLAFSAHSLICLTIVLMIFIVGLAMTLKLLYGNEFGNMSSVGHVSRLLLTGFLKASEIEMSHYIKYKSALFFFAVYGVFIIITIYFFILIIVMAYTRAQRSFSNQMREYNVRDYFIEQIRYVPKFVHYKYRRRMRGGQEEIPKVEAKSDKFLYSNCFSVSSDRMEGMQSVTRCCIRNANQTYAQKRKFTVEDFSLMLKVCQQFLHYAEKSDDVEVFFKGRIRGSRISLIDEKRIMKIANIVQIILQENYEISPIVQTPNRNLVQNYIRMVEKKQRHLEKCSLILNLALFKMDKLELDLFKIIKTN